MNETISALFTNGLAFYFLIDILAVIALSYGIYFRRYYDRDAATASVLFNVFIFAVITVFLELESGISVGFGFGLFAILSLITLRSEPLTKTDITFFFGSLVLALVNALAISNFGLVLVINIVILATAWIVDHPKLLQGIQNTKITLDHIPEAILQNNPQAIKNLSTMFGVDVVTYRVIAIDKVKDTAQLEIAYKKQS